MILIYDMSTLLQNAPRHGVWPAPQGRKHENP
jgi:hypothetical protein